MVLTIALGPVAFAADEAPVTGAFGPAGTLDRARDGHTATLLPDGRIFVAGGTSSRGQSLSSTELWDPEAASFSRSGPLGSRRTSHTATLLADGRVLVVGGDDGERVVPSAETWDPVTATSEPAGPLLEPRMSHTATLLPDGRALIVGGSGEGQLASAEIWDSSTDSFSTTTPLVEARANHTATALLDGRVLIVGGFEEHEDGSEEVRDSAELWNPMSARFEPTGPLLEARSEHAATLLSDGRVLVVGGWDREKRLASAEIWDLDTGTFSRAGALAEPRWGHSAAALPDGRVLVVGGWDEGSAEVWDPKSTAFGFTGPPREERSLHTATLLPDGRVLVVGGVGRYGHVVTAETWDSSLSQDQDAATGPTYELGRRAAESDLLFGVRRDLRGACRPMSGRLPAGAVARIDCRPSDRNVRRVSIGLFESERALLDAYFDRLAEFGFERDEARAGRCRPDRPSDGPYHPTLPEDRLEYPFRSGCFIDAAGRAHYIATSPPFVLSEVTGRSKRGDIEAVEDFARKGNRDVPGGPTICCRGRQMNETHRDLEASLPRPLACEPYRRSAVANDPSSYGARAAINCGRISSEGSPQAAYMTLFRFPEGSAMRDYWSFRVDQNPDMSSRSGSCRDGNKGYGSWTHGEYFCYVSETGGHALLRWTDERTNTYGVLDATNTKLEPLYRAWTELRP
jgi:WD40 repeat protein